MEHKDLKFTTAGEYMSTRIQEIAKEVGYVWHASGEPQIYEFTPEKLEKFARMIVSDCAGIVYNNCDDDEEGERISQLILKAYGVGDHE